MIIEGVHLYPEVLDGLDLDGCALVHVVLSVPSEADHRSHFVLRDVQTGGRRPAADYVPHFERIRKVHDYLVERGRELGYEIIDTSDPNRTLPALSQRIVAQLRATVEQS
jgi:2-phosphoglycerate kinase